MLLFEKYTGDLFMLGVTSENWKIQKIKWPQLVNSGGNNCFSNLYTGSAAFHTQILWYVTRGEVYVSISLGDRD